MNNEAKHVQRLIADECLDAHGDTTVRLDDGTPNGNLDAGPIATVYSTNHVSMIVAAPELLSALKAALEIIRPLAKAETIKAGVYADCVAAINRAEGRS